MIYLAIGLLLYIDIAYPNIFQMCLLQAIQLQVGILAHECFYHLCRQEITIISRMVTEKELCLSALFHHYKHSAIDHQIHVRPQDVHNLYRPVHLHIARHIDKKSVLRQHRVEGGDTILRGRSQFGIIRSYQLGANRGYVSQGVDYYPLGQTRLGQHLAIETVVDDKIERSAQVWHVTTESLIGVYGYLQPIEIQSEIGREQLVDVRILISFHLARREAQAAKVFISLVAHGIERRGGMRLDKPGILLVKLFILSFTCHKPTFPCYSLTSAFIQS